MGTYCTSTSIYNKSPGLDNTSTNTTIIDQCISQAEEHIKCSISKRYDVTAFDTSTSIPPLLRTLCERYTEGLFWEANSRGGKDALLRSEFILKRVDEKLKMIADYKTDLLNTAGSQISELANSSFAITASADYIPTFAEDDYKNWRVDPDKIDDIEDDRA